MMDLHSRLRCSPFTILKSSLPFKAASSTCRPGRGRGGVTYAFKNFGDGLLDYMEGTYINFYSLKNEPPCGRINDIADIPGNMNTRMTI